MKRLTLAVPRGALLAVLIASPSFAGPINFQEHVLPIFREHCVSCHNPQKESSGLALDSYARVIQGGSGGEVVFAGDTESSRLWALVNHDDEPKMPPNQDKLPEAKLTVLKQWIMEGLLERADSAPVAKKPSLLATAVQEEDDQTPGAMPVGVCREPVNVAVRTGAVPSVAVSPRAPLLAIAAQHQVLLYHSDSLELLGVLPFLEGLPTTIHFSRDGKYLFAAGGIPGKSGCGMIFDVATGRRVARVGDELDAVMAADLDRTLQFVVFGGTNRLIRGWDIASDSARYEIKKHTDWVTALEISPDGKFLATGDRQGGLVVWEAPLGREYQVLEGHAAAVTSICWRGDSTIFATSSEDGTVRLWNREKTATERSWDAHPGGALAVRFGKNGRIVSVGRDRTPKMWDTTANNLATFPSLTEIGLAVDLTYDGKQVIAADWAGKVKIYTTDPVAERAELDSNPPRGEEALRIAEQITTESEAELITRRTAAEQAKAALDAAIVAHDGAVDAYLLARRDLERDRVQSQTAGQPVDLSSREAALVDLERNCGRTAANRKEAEALWSQSSTALVESEHRAQSAKARRDAAATNLKIFQEAPAGLIAAVAAAEENLKQSEATLAKRLDLQVRLESLATSVAELRLEQARLDSPPPGDSSPEAAPANPPPDELGGVIDRRIADHKAQCALAKTTQELAEADLAAAQEAMQLFQQAYPNP